MMKGFSSEFEFKRYGHLFALSLLLSSGEEFWFNGELYQACESHDLAKVRKTLIEANPSIWMFADVIGWGEVAQSALAIYKSSNAEHNSLLERLNLLTTKTENTLS